MLNERSKIKQKTPNNEGNRLQYSLLYKRVKKSSRRNDQSSELGS